MKGGSIARVYDAMLGGKINYEVDRAVLRDLREVAPHLPTIAHDNRAWLARVTRFLVRGAGLEQIIDCGSGFPTTENTHEVAVRSNPDARVVYIDNDPVVAAYSRALLADSGNAFFANADLTRPREVFAHDTVAASLDLATPTGLLQAATLHHVADKADPVAIMREYVDLLPSGSCVAISHFHAPHDDGRLSRMARNLQEIMVDSTMGSGYFRSRDEITAMFAGLELVEPGLVPLPDWWPNGPRSKDLLDVQHLVLGGVARKP